MHKHNTPWQGFTLIELLVVIAIISILASIIVVSLNTTRSLARDRGIQSNMNVVRQQMELYANENGGIYVDWPGTTTIVAAPGGGCAPTAFSTYNVALAVKNAGLISGASVPIAGGVGALVCVISDNMWQIAVVLSSDSSKAACADSYGRSSIIPVPAGAVFSC